MNVLLLVVDHGGLQLDAIAPSSVETGVNIFVASVIESTLGSGAVNGDGSLVLWCLDELGDNFQFNEIHFGSRIF